MSARFARGLVVGKLSPLHLGHELLIGRALDACDELWVVSYSEPVYPGCGAAERERWLGLRFPDARRLVVTEAMLEERAPCPFAAIPHNDAPETEHRRFCTWLCLEVLGGPVDAVFTSEAYGEGFAAYLTAAFRAVRRNAPDVRHVLVDMARVAVPISATRIRSDVHAARRWLAPEVYASFVERVCLLGGESTGKSTLAAALAERLGTRFVAEYGRELWERKEGRLEYEDLLEIGMEQVAREEEAASSADRYLVCDTSPLTTLFYSGALFGRADQRLFELAERRYHHTFLCSPDVAFVQDGTRQDESFRQRQHEWYVEELARRGIPHAPIAGSTEERVRQVVALLRERR